MSNLPLVKETLLKLNTEARSLELQYGASAQLNQKIEEWSDTIEKNIKDVLTGNADWELFTHALKEDDAGTDEEVMAKFSKYDAATKEVIVLFMELVKFCYLSEGDNTRQVYWYEKLKNSC